jgi:hypothetical protein
MKQLKTRLFRVELTRIESGNGLSRKPSAHAVLADKSRNSLGKPLPFGPVGFRLVPPLGAESRQPDGNIPVGFRDRPFLAPSDKPMPGARLMALLHSPREPTGLGPALEASSPRTSACRSSSSRSSCSVRESRRANRGATLVTNDAALKDGSISRLVVEDSLY